jgi:hypothetical protein
MRAQGAEHALIGLYAVLVTLILAAGFVYVVHVFKGLMNRVISEDKPRHMDLSAGVGKFQVTMKTGSPSEPAESPPVRDEPQELPPAQDKP